MSARPTYLFAGGGTGGHLFPGLAVAHELVRRDERTRIVFVGSGREIERTVLSSSGYEHVVLPSESTAMLRRRPLRFVWRNLLATGGARRLVRSERPAAVVGLGGFASAPVVWAGSRAGVPTLLLEQNVLPGRATRWLSRRASLVCATFEETRAHLSSRVPLRVTGNPVRQEIAALMERAAGEVCEQNVLLVLGGSQGATAVNEAVLGAAGHCRDLLRGWRIVHQTGAGREAGVAMEYRALGLEAEVAPFIADLVPWYRAAGVVVSRAGATTLAELACAGCPAVLIPFPGAVRDHQRLNAEALASAGGARVVTQGAEPREIGQRLAEELATLLPRPEERARMRDSMRRLARPDAAARVAEELLNLVG